MTADAMTTVTLTEAAALLRSQREFVNVDFTGLDLRRALPADHETPYVFRGCVFRDASVAGLDLSGATFGHCVFDEADFTGTHLDDTMWRGVQGMKLIAEKASALRARFDGCNLLGADFSLASLAEASFTTTRLTGANFAKARLRDTHFADCQLVAADMRGVSLHKQTLRQVDLSEANLSGADFRDAVLQACRLRDARLVDARFAGADLRGADLGVLTPASCMALRGATISSAQAAALVRGLGLVVL